MLEIDPKHVSAHIGLGIAYSEQGNLDDAVTAGKKAVQLEPKNAWARYYLAFSYALKNAVLVSIDTPKQAVN